MSVTPAYDDCTAELRELDATLASVRAIVASGATHVPRIFRLRNPEQQLRAQEHPPSATVPVINLGGNHVAVVDVVARIASEWGFFQVTGHGVPEEAMAAAVAAVRAFHEADGGKGSDCENRPI
jgi:alkanesulfonate monooxygenase SsuD/methylene tetrahydromethanopterin reductase-like flavin-dependent oxidoreductase (luciferase family)